MIKAKRISIHPTAQISGGAQIAAGELDIGPYCKIGSGVDIECPGGFSLGACGEIGEDAQIRCWKFRAGDYLYMEHGVDVGRGSSLHGADCVLWMGRGVFVGKESTINVSRRVSIGDEVGIGARCGIWTHGAYLPEDLGFPVSFAPVTIGSRSWLPGCSNVLPGVVIGANVVVGMMSLVNKDLP